MRCPTCGKCVSFEGNRFRPFCSERCKLIDLDNWLSGRYRLSTPVTPAEESGPSTTNFTGMTGAVSETGADAKADRE